MFHSPGTAASQILFNLTLIYSVIKRKIFLHSYLARGLGKKIHRHQYAIKILAKFRPFQLVSAVVFWKLCVRLIMQFSMHQSRQHTGLIYKAAAAADAQKVSRMLRVYQLKRGYVSHLLVVLAVLFSILGINIWCFRFNLKYWTVSTTLAFETETFLYFEKNKTGRLQLHFEFLLLSFMLVDVVRRFSFKFYSIRRPM